MVTGSFVGNTEQLEENVRSMENSGTMNATRFFRYIWRINAVLILFTAILVTCMLAIFLVQLLDSGGNRSRQAVDVANTPEFESEPASLGTLHEVDGTTFLRAPLTFGKRYGGKALSGSMKPYSTRNYLFLDSETLAVRWLFPADTQLIVDSDELRESIALEGGSTKPARRTNAFSYQVVDTDSDGDGRLTPEDLLTLGYSRPDGSEYTVAIEGISRVMGSTTNALGSKHVVLYEADGRWRSAVISLKTFEVEQVSELPPR
jgi:hypothetical protein